MSEYRKMEVELVKSKKNNTISIYDLTNIFTKDDRICRFCLSHNKDEYEVTTTFKFNLCCPNNRIKLKGFFRPLYCSIDGFHNHYICKVCKTQWIVKLNNVISSNNIEIISSF